MAVVRHRAWLQRLEFDRQPAAIGCDSRISQRALLRQAMKSISTFWFRVCRSAVRLVEDGRGNAAVEFAVIVPVMLVMFFGTVEFSSGVAVDRKVTLMARTLSDLTSQSTSVATTDLTNFQELGAAIMT